MYIVYSNKLLHLIVYLFFHHSFLVIYNLCDFQFVFVVVAIVFLAFHVIAIVFVYRIRHNSRKTTFPSGFEHFLCVSIYFGEYIILHRIGLGHIAWLQNVKSNCLKIKIKRHKPINRMFSHSILPSFSHHLSNKCYKDWYSTSTQIKIGKKEENLFTFRF